MNQKEGSSFRLFCEEFESRGAVPEEAVLQKEQKEGGSVEPSVPSDTLKGLCVNCDLRKDCTFSDAVSGIWYCREYR